MLPAPAHGPETPSAPFTPGSLLREWEVQLWPTLILVALGAVYLIGLVKLRRRGDPWPLWRALSWITGLGVIFFATSSALGVYDGTLFSVHAVQHMLLQMLSPVLLVVAAPVTLALRTLPLRPRRTFLAVTHSRPARIIAHPAVAFSIFGLSQFVLYYTPLYEATLRYEWLHNLSHAHFVSVGFLFYWSLLAIDPVPHRPQHVLKFLLVLGMAPLHVLLGIPIMMSKQLIAGRYYTELARTWGPSLLEDQHIGGAILWAFGDVSAILLIGAFLMVWSRADEREARRVDRQLDRRHGSAVTVGPWWLEQPPLAHSEEETAISPPAATEARHTEPTSRSTSAKATANNEARAHDPEAADGSPSSVDTSVAPATGSQ